MAMTHMITTSGLSKRYGKTLRVKDVDLLVPEGAVYGFLGPNGAGKTTTLKMILGLVKPTAGSITLFGRPINRRNRLSILRQIGSLIESPSYYGHLTGEENLRIVSTLREVPYQDIDRVLKTVRLENQSKKAVQQYSLGMKQRLALACALLGNPKLLILDEPTNGLDPAGIQEMRELICSLPGQFGTTVLVSSHLLSEIDQMATNVGIISQGELVFQGSMDTLHKMSRPCIAIRTLDNWAAADLMLKQGIHFDFHHDYLLLPASEDEIIAEYVDQLSRKQVGIVRVEERRKSLEDIFLDLTGTVVSL